MPRVYNVPYDCTAVVTSNGTVSQELFTGEKQNGV
jgi:hypothetical protein